MTAPLPWWRTGVIYQIYPKSFQDSTGSGTGDLQGIISRLAYLQQLGVDALWLTPVYPSPQVDNGYDVADYCDIDPAYGTMHDMETLIAQAHARGMRIIMDMVFNHTSTQHHWFIQAQTPDSDYRAFYCWRAGTETTPPNNWRSKFGGNAWQWHAPSQQHYLHLFAPEQADLNWEHAPVREALQAICHFWADKGVDGLRLDVINLVSKQQDFPSDSEGDGRRYYTDGPRMVEFLQEFNRTVFSPRELMTVGEMSSTTLENCLHYAPLTGNALSMTFNFHHLKVDYPGGEKWTLAAPDFVALKALFTTWQRGMHNKAWSALFWCNHDQPRIVSRFGDEGDYRTPSAKMLAMVLHGMQGTPYIYQGEEIGMTNPGYDTLEHYRDIESLNIYAEHLAKGETPAQVLRILAHKSRDNGRSPMQWSAAPSAGFTSGTPWISPGSGYAEINVSQALADPHSVFYTYQRLIALRKALPLLTYGDYHDLAPEHPTIWFYRRRWQGQQLLVLANLSREIQYYALPNQPSPQNWRLLLSNYDDSPVHPASLTLRPYEAIYWLSDTEL